MSTRKQVKKNELKALTRVKIGINNYNRVMLYIPTGINSNVMDSPRDITPMFLNTACFLLEDEMTKNGGKPMIIYKEGKPLYEISIRKIYEDDLKIENIEIKGEILSPSAAKSLSEIAKSNKRQSD